MPGERLPLDEPRAAVQNHLLALTGLRILPALAVYVYHVHAPAGSPEWLARAIGLGFGGVTVFFVLSGFVLAINYWDTLTHPTANVLRRYGAARIARIYPLYLLVLAYVYLHTHVPTGAPMSSWPWHVVGLQAWLPNVLDAWSFGPAWSISVELFLYATLPLLVLLLRPLKRTSHLLIALGLTAAALIAVTWWFSYSGRAALPWTDPGSDHRWLYRMPLTRVFDFMLGILGARLYVAIRPHVRAGRYGSLLVAVSSLVFVLLLTQDWVWATPYRWDVAWALPGIALILGLALGPAGALARFLATPVIVLLGEASYAFYLIQISVAKSFGGGSWTVDATPSRIALELMALGLALALSVGLHLGVERPARVWVRRWLGGRSRTAPQPEPAVAPATTAAAGAD